MKKKNLFIVVLFLFIINNLAIGKTPKSPDKQKTSNSKNFNKILEEKQKLLQLKGYEASLEKLEFERGINKIREKIQKLELEKKLEEAELEAFFRAERIKLQKQAFQIKKDTEITKLLAEKLETKMKHETIIAKRKVFHIEQDIQINTLNTEKIKKKIENKNLQVEASKYIDLKEEYPDNPIIKKDILLISKRNIKLDGIITSVKANYVEDKINFFNNKDTKKPIFLVIDKNYGGDITAGTRILQAMKTSTAPVYVVVKSFAASMAAAITASAKKSFAFANSRILHHQPIMSTFFYQANTKEQEYSTKMSQEIRRRFLGPVAKKMGISLKSFLKKMDENSAKGDWIEFSDNAIKLKWVDKVIRGIKYTNIEKNPEKSDYTNFKYLKEIFDIDGQQIELKKCKNKMYIQVNALPGEYFYIYNDPLIKINY